MNNLNGTVPFKNCDDFQVLSSDCSQPITITCPCCTRCFGLFTVNEDVLSCPSSILQVRPLEGTNRLEFYIENDYGQLITEQLKYTKHSEVVEACISPTDCMTVTSTTRNPFVVSVNGNTLFDKIEGFGWKEYFGYASDGTVKPNTCDDYVVCNRALRKGTPHRNLVNLITRFSGVVSQHKILSNIYNLNIWHENVFRIFLMDNPNNAKLYAGGWMTLIQKPSLSNKLL